MMRHRLTLLVLCLVVSAVSIAEAQNDYHALYNRYLFHQMALSPRSAAMGGAYTALPGGETGLSGNPAALGFVVKPFISIDGGWEDIASDTTFEDPNLGVEADTEMWDLGVGGAYPFDWGTIGFKYGYREDDIGSHEALTSLGFMGLNGDLERHSGSLLLASECYEDLSFGMNHTYINWEADTSFDVSRPAPFQVMAIHEHYEGARHQFGVQYKANQQVILGMDGSFGYGDRVTTGAGQSNADSYAIRAGLSWAAIPDVPLLLALDIKYESRELDSAGLDSDEDLFGLHLGAEYEVYDHLFLRAGYMFEDFDYQSGGIDESFGIGGYSTGFGYHYDHFNFNYAFMYIDTGSGDTAHLFGIGYEF